jgi:hypothetical protein
MGVDQSRHAGLRTEVDGFGARGRLRSIHDILDAAALDHDRGGTQHLAVGRIDEMTAFQRSDGRRGGRGLIGTGRGTGRKDCRDGRSDGQ